MSIQKSLRLSLVLMACLPLIFLTIFTYNLSYKKYMDLATQSTVELAKNYGMGFQSQLNSQIAEVEGLAMVQTSRILYWRITMVLRLEMILLIIRMSQICLQLLLIMPATT